MKNKRCPCNSKTPYTLCCGRYHKGKLNAPTAEALMRSRFSAYVVNDIQYIYRTWDKKTRPPLKVLRQNNPQIFTQLQILNHTYGNPQDETGTVEFIASYKIDNSEDIHQHHENSYFLKQNKRWVYVNEVSKIDIK